jgi:hypothetical protein
MPTNEEIKQAIAKASEMVSNPSPEFIKALGAVDGMLDEKTKSDDELTKAHAQLREDYRKAILEAPLKPLGTKEEQGTGAPKATSFEEALTKAANDAAKEKK